MSPHRLQAATPPGLKGQPTAAPPRARHLPESYVQNSVAASALKIQGRIIRPKFQIIRPKYPGADNPAPKTQKYPAKYLVIPGGVALWSIAKIHHAQNIRGPAQIFGLEEAGISRGRIIRPNLGRIIRPQIWQIQIQI